MDAEGWLYYGTDRGSTRATDAANGYKGDWVLRTHRETLKTELVYRFPVPMHCLPASVLDAERMIYYGGTAASRDAEKKSVMFFAIDLRERKILKVAEGGFDRCAIFDPQTGRIFWGVKKRDAEGNLSAEGRMYDPATNEITASATPHVRSATRVTRDGWAYGTSFTKDPIWAFNVRTGELKSIGEGGVAKQTYITSMELDPTERYLYYVPGAHGGAAADGSPVVQYDLTTGKRKVIAFLHDVIFDKYGYAPEGSFGNALSEDGSTYCISWDGWRKGQPRGTECAAITVVHIPESERSGD